MLGATVKNAFILFKLANLTTIMTHWEFQHQIALNLMQNPAGIDRKKACQQELIGGRPRKVPRPTHDWLHYETRDYCQVCHVTKKRPFKR
jgi:hypothetical protein